MAVSVNGWTRRLAKRGLVPNIVTNEDGVVIASVIAPDAPVDVRFPVLIGIGVADSQDEAIEAALRDFETKRENQRREQIVRALADPSAARVNTGSRAAVGGK